MKKLILLAILSAYFINVKAQTTDAGRMSGGVDVTPTGAAAYSLPIAVPPGLNGVAPQIALIYNSQGGNGVAGYGWNISGLSSISRIPSTLYHEGKVGGINFDANDRFALDGQRLILKTGTYGGDGAEYQTENYSNIKIISKGVSSYGATYGPASFEVYYPDGTKVYYGTTSDSQTKTAFGISYSENINQARITYTYSTIFGVLKATKIEYGSKGTAVALNTISFVYKNSDRIERSYVGGQSLTLPEVLSEISVKANNVAYRNYVLTQETTALKYQRVTKITEYNGDKTRILDPTTFTYSTSGNTINYKKTTLTSVQDIGRGTHEVLTGDFTGDGSVDIILYPSSKDRIYTFWNPTTSAPSDPGQALLVGAFKDILPVVALDDYNRVMREQRFVLVKEVNSTNSSKISFDVCGYKAGSYNKFYTKDWTNVPTTGGYYSSCQQANIPGTPIPKKYLTGDFNGDGLTELLAVDYVYTKPIYDQPCSSVPGSSCCNTQYTPIVSSNAYLANLDKSTTSNFVSSVGGLPKQLDTGDQLYTIDINGDGKTDILHVKGGKMSVYTINASNQITTLYSEITDAGISLNFPALLGDYNGDGKADVLFPTADNSDVGALFTSNGVGFTSSYSTLPFLYLNNTFQKDPQQASNMIARDYTVIPNDINSDGKTDLIRVFTETYTNKGPGKYFIDIYDNTGLSGDQPMFNKGSTLSLTNEPSILYPIPLFLRPDKANPRLELGLLSGSSLEMFTAQRDHRIDARLTNVNNNGVDNGFSHQFLTATSGYTSTENQIYPYIDLPELSGLSVVNKLTNNASGTLQKLFTYKNGVSHMQGLGFQGFGITTQTNWHAYAADPILKYNINFSKPELRGAVYQSFTSKSISSIDEERTTQPTFPVEKRSSASVGAVTVSATQAVILLPGFETKGQDGTFIAQIKPTNQSIVDGASSADYITRTDYRYKTQTTANKVFINVPESVVTKETLGGVTNTSSYEYDSYYNVTQEVSAFGNDGTKITDVVYENSTGSNFYIGRPLTKKVSLSNGADNYTTEEQYTYINNRPSEIKKKGHNTGFITEKLEYDTYGNIVKKTISTPNNGSRSSSMAYDVTTGRFLISTTDVEGMTTSYDPDPSTGAVRTRTNPYNQTDTYTYDTWGRQIKVVDYLGTAVATTYTQVGAEYRIEETSGTGEYKRTSIDRRGNVILKRTKTVLGALLDTKYGFDPYGRLFQEYLPGSTTEYNTTVYDEYNRVKKITSYTGKNTTITYPPSSLTTTVSDGTKTVTTIKNALGQVVSTQDPGGTINNNYFANGNLKSASFDGSIQTIEQDGWGRKTKLTDPSAGVYTYEYSDFSEVTKETTPKGTTTYQYSPAGTLSTKKIIGGDTDMSYTYTYDSGKKLLTSSGLTNTDGNNTTYTYAYNTNKQLSSAVEDNLHAVFTKTYTYDAYGRISTEASEAKNKRNNKVASKAILNTYQNGELLAVSDKVTQALIWKVTELNYRGQLKTAFYGSALKETTEYDYYGLPEEIRTDKGQNANTVELMKLTYTFDALRGNLKNRSNTAFTWSESFDYDNLDRLTVFNDNNGNQTQGYDNKGRIASSSAIGNYVYSSSSYRLDALENLNAMAKTYYESRPQQEISYNAFKSPVVIWEQGKEKINFQYNGALDRSHIYYGGEQTDKMSRPYRRHYSEDGSMEITEDITGNTTSFVFYIGGDAYSAPAIWKEVHTATATTKILYFLHRDYQGSILMITDDTGAIKEKRAFDAWGNIVKLTDGAGNALTAFVILDRGYTGHEHLLGVGLIHMNGRLYDPKLHRFLQPDNYIQDPSNTQNFNRYGYVMNNPLKYTDESGEFFLWTIITGAVDLLNTAFFKGGLDPTSSSARNNAWKNFDPSASWSKTNKAFKIDMGVFQTDPNRSFFGRVWQFISRVTWEIPQTVVGNTFAQIRNLSGNVDRVDYFGGATLVNKDDPTTAGGGMTLGSYILGTNLRASIDDETFMHEYGHTLQSMQWGLFYFAPAIISGVDSWINGTSEWSQNPDYLKHDIRWYETEANRKAARYFNKHYGVNWNDRENPRSKREAKNLRR